jgi:type IV pilus assembly protein PilY1
MKHEWKMKIRIARAARGALLLALLPLAAQGQVTVSDTLTGASSTYSWKALNGACMTAGTTSTTTGTVPACKGLAYYGSQTLVGGTTGTLPDAVGSGALRLTNGGSGGTYGKGSVVSTVPFATSEGVQVTFTTVTYGGNNSNSTGADGVTFFLLDGTQDQTALTLGGAGGSLGYSCSNSNSPYDGVTKGYLSVGIDEYGSFGNKNDNTATGNTSQKPGTIGVRGAGDISWASLAANYPAYYPGSTTSANKLAAVKNTCSSGYLWNYNNYVTTSNTSCSGRFNNNCTTTTTSTFTPVQTTTAASDYPLLVYPTAFTGTISNQQIVNSSSATPVRGKAYPITYALKVTSDNLLSLSYSYNGGATVSVIADKDITTGNASLPTSFLFGFSAGTGAGSNVHEITCFKAAAINTASNSAGSNTTQSQKVISGTQVYLSYYHPLNSWGQLLATSLTADSSSLVTLASTANWDAHCKLTGGDCSATGVATARQDPALRQIDTWNPATAAAGYLSYAGLSAAQRTALGATSATAQPVVNYLRGVRTSEVTSGGAYRNRDSVLGDIRGSSPTWVGPPSSPYSTAGNDLLTKTQVSEFGTKYSAFVTTNATRQHVVYNGSNDGMMHGFRAGSYTASGTYVSTANDGQEVIAYMPDAAITSIHSLTSTALDFASPSYGHNYFVDATPGTGDLYYGGEWHTWLVGGMGAGGNPGGATADTACCLRSTSRIPPSSPPPAHRPRRPAWWRWASGTRATWCVPPIPRPRPARAIWARSMARPSSAACTTATGR